MMCVAVLSTTSVTRLTDAWALMSKEEQVQKKKSVCVLFFDVFEFL